MEESISVGIVGVGFVGGAIAKAFNLYTLIKTYDINPKRSTHTLRETISSDFVFVCLPTPMTNAEGGECNLSIIYKFFNELCKSYLSKNNQNQDTIFVIKSTVPVGTTDALIEECKRKKININIVHSPEFLTARAALIDALTPARHIVGGSDESIISKVADLYNNRFPGVPCYTMSSNESELVKYAANTFFATKIMFFNEIRLLADKMNLDWNNIIEGVLSDGRIAKSHYQVPGYDLFRGFGGLCFSKDINAIIHTMEMAGINPMVLKAVWEQNKAIRKNWDWANNESAVSSIK